MSIHMRDIGDAVLELFHLHRPTEPKLNDDQRLLIEAYLSGQVPEPAWQEHLTLDPELARYWQLSSRH
ncbi:hypothetical protein LAC81_36855 (plasmid) [Ensifer adhaerens]|uniref:hypothetical protein n=1 Tax=Ensifer adhaerens TaxID=106592 RepID=UPI001CBBEB05|nr:hypothetical protein [Ensifer adhaerens]MBZ7927509.1 hypothetical protein [Ensifer adhaerens]UAX97930.1 hypothetical protein LAC78_38160 [Ensifer adhaerens]UAY05309.1 hypothetical protein LAC80_36870 [Ensifer adhaerens]UAY12687.1 hypothetical protein LAC81_36855 [Ensifer adhaerens]